MTSTAPAKSQPLHNFSLPQWKWPKNHTTNHQRGRKLGGASSQQPSPPSDSALHQSPSLDSAPSAPRESPIRLPPPPPQFSPMRDCASGSESGYVSSVKSGLVYEKRKHSAAQCAKVGVPTISSSDHNKGENSEKKMGLSDSDISGVKEGRSKILIRFRANVNKSDDVQDEGKADANVEGKIGTDVGEGDESIAKTWNLRPRKPMHKQINANGGTSKVGGSSSHENRARSQHVTSNQCGPETNSADKKKTKKQKFSISLSREEIEDDIFALTGSKPARRPKKRAKTVQKQLDNLFPGLWLSSVTPDSYKVSEAPLKG